MKKYILMVAVAAATTLVACGDKAAENTEVAPADSVEVVEEVVEVVDSLNVDSAAAVADSAAVAE